MEHTNSEGATQGNSKLAGNSGGNQGNNDLSGFLGDLKIFLGDLLDIRINTDQKATKESIIDDIAFKGHTSWILMCSVFIASVGLNANSTAVVIGAMLISPLMGPILGMGFSLAVNDIDTLRRSLKNFTVMVVLSILTAFLFFKFFPLRDESSELLARTAPDIRDVLIAFFGGLALVIARAKRGTVASVIFGVAIATALMPPLCTAGFSLANGNMEHFFGAMYLFMINTIFIGLATFLIIKFLKFPMVRYANSQKRRRTAQLASLIGILVMIPAGKTFYDVLQESKFKNQAENFINDNIKTYQFSGSGFVLDKSYSINYNNGENSIIEFVIIGDESIPENVIETWKVQMDKYPKLQATKLRIKGGENSDSEEKFQYVTELYEQKKKEMVSKDRRIEILEKELERLSKFSVKAVPFDEISKEIKINYDDITELGFGNEIKTDFTKTDTIPVFFVKWKKGTSANQEQIELKKLKQWLSLRMESERIEVRKFN